jgi:hypothetical protein
MLNFKRDGLKQQAIKEAAKGIVFTQHLESETIWAERLEKANVE